MLDQFPIIKLLSGRPDNKALSALRQCSLELYPDPESSDDLFDVVETAMENADAEIIADLSAQLHEKDVQIELLENRMANDRAIALIFLVLVIILCSAPYVVRSERLRSEKLKEIKVEEKNLKAIKIDPKKTIYTIQM